MQSIRDNCLAHKTITFQMTTSLKYTIFCEIDADSVSKMRNCNRRHYSLSPTVSFKSKVLRRVDNPYFSFVFLGNKRCSCSSLIFWVILGAYVGALVGHFSN